MNVKNYSKKQLMSFYETMFKTRRFEEETFEFYKKGMMAGLAHLYMGEEAVAAGVCAALKEDDYIGSTHRGHGASGSAGSGSEPDDGGNSGERDRLLSWKGRIYAHHGNGQGNSRS